MPLLVEFVAKFLQDPNVRYEVLLDDQGGLEKQNLTESQIAILKTFDPDRILCELHNELRGLGIDMRKKHLEILGYSSPDSPIQDCLELTGCVGATLQLSSALEAKVKALMSSSAYSSPDMHPRKIDPASIAAGTPKEIEIIGNGFDSNMHFQFINGAGVVGVTKGTLTSDVDLYQRQKVTVEFAQNQKGNWKLQVSRDGNTWKHGDKPLYIEVA